MDRFFPVLLIIIDLLAALVYLVYGDWNRSIYWTAAAVLTACVTWR